MPRPKATPATDSPQALAIATATQRLPAKVARLGKTWLAKIRGLDTIEDAHGIRAVVVHNEKQHAAALEAAQLGKEFKKAVDAATKPSEAEMRRRAVRKELLDTEKRVSKLTTDAALVFREAETKRLEEEARAEAEKEHAELVKQQEAEARKLAGRAKRTKDPEKKAELEAAAQEVRDEPVQSVDSAVQEVLAEQKAGWRGAGRGSTRTNWSAEVDNLLELVLWVVEAPGSRIQFIQANQVALNDHARRAESEELKIPGVRGVSSKTLART